MEKIKYWLADDRIFYSILLVVVAITAFGIGRASATEKLVSNVTPRVEMLQTASPIASGAESVRSTPVVAASGGTRYYYTHCRGIDRIKEENKVYFDSIEAAEAAGYTLALQCEP